MGVSEKSGTRFYWCVNCGYHGDFGKQRVKGLKCQRCGYDDITTLDSEEWEEYNKLEAWLNGETEELK